MGKAIAVNPLLECCTSLFALTAPFRGGDRGESLPGNYRERILAGFDEMERMAFERKITMQVVKDARYAMAAYVDEVVLTSQWPGRMDWMAKPLQLEFFGDHSAGEGFFTRLAELRQGGERNLDLLELYFVCLQLGFEGAYRFKGLEQLMALQVDLKAQIDGYRGTRSLRLSPRGLPRETAFTRARNEIPYWVIGTVTAAAVFFTYVGYSYVTDRMTEESVAAIAALHKDVDPASYRAVYAGTRRDAP